MRRPDPRLRHLVLRRRPDDVGRRLRPAAPGRRHRPGRRPARRPPDPRNPAQPDPSSCAPARPVPVITFRGQQDATNPYQGGGDVWRYPIPGAQARWAAINRCTSGPAAVSVTTHVTRTSYPNCAADTVLYTIGDGGHTGPGTPAAFPGNGTTTQEIGANTLMWQFFQRLTLPASQRSIGGLLAHTAGSPHWTARRLVPGSRVFRRWAVAQRPTVPGVRHGLVRGRAAVP
ncbi:hypothetical protein [Dactylosporangium sp. NPDC006015]|uniref:hypothetical protein n=1 Tax=Dactylosporangium sp. NPDC006015 TaxID=3154576 RepID=UPI0033B9E95D